MSSETHRDPSQQWLIFFFCCFFSSIFAIGVWAAFNYKVDAPEPVAAAGHH